MRAILERLRTWTAEAGRDPADVGIGAHINTASGDLSEWVRQTEAWRTLGATHVSLNTMKAGYTELAHHLEALRTYAEAVQP